MRHWVNERAFALRALLLLAAMSEGCGQSSSSPKAVELGPAPTSDAPLVVDPLRPGASIICDTAAPDGEGTIPAIFVLSAMNHKLQQFPEFGAAIGLELASDCDGALRFVQGYRDYSREHPGFDADEPLAPRAADPDPPAVFAPPHELGVSKILGGMPAVNSPVVKLTFTTCSEHGCPNADDSWKVHDFGRNTLIDFRRGPFECSGTFIAKNWILTSAHCITAAAVDHCLESGAPRAGCEPHWNNYGSWAIRGTYSADVGKDGVAGTADDRPEYNLSFQAESYVIENYIGTTLTSNPLLCDVANCYDSAAGADEDLALLYIRPQENDYALPPTVEDDGAKRLSVVTPDPNWPFRIAGWGKVPPSGQQNVLQQAGGTAGAIGSVAVPSGNSRLAVSVGSTGPAVCPGDSGGPVLRTQLSMNTNRGSKQNVEAIAAVISASSAKCDGTDTGSISWLATRVDTAKHQKFILDSFHRWPQYQLFNCWQRFLDPPGAQTEVMECWGDPCDDDLHKCKQNEICSQSPRIVLGQAPSAARFCPACANFVHDDFDDDQDCNCVAGQCLATSPP